MKKVLWFILMLVSMTAAAQKDVTKFLGIPVDGYKSEMKKKLIDKGFTYNPQYDFLDGEFNGRNVHVYIVTNNNKVWRIMVADANPCSETDIKIRFNTLCRQFSKNPKYVPANFEDDNYIISESEDISYEMLVHKKRYEAAFYQIPEPSLIDSIALNRKIREVLLQEYTQEEIENPTKKQKEKIDTVIEYETKKVYFELMEKKNVWFMISETYGEYFISLFYDNEYNHSDGEDL